jgi:hypothetical protein
VRCPEEDHDEKSAQQDAGRTDTSRKRAAEDLLRDGSRRDGPGTKGRREPR